MSKWSCSLRLEDRRDVKFQCRIHLLHRLQGPVAFGEIDWHLLLIEGDIAALTADQCLQLLRLEIARIVAKNLLVTDARKERYGEKQVISIKYAEINSYIYRKTIKVRGKIHL